MDDSTAVQTAQDSSSGISPDTRASAVATRQTAGRWFSADQGSLLYIGHQADPVDADVQPLRDAVLLDEHDDLLRCVDAWLSQSHDWRPFEPIEPMPASQVILRMLSEPSRCISLILPSSVEGSGQGRPLSTVNERKSLPGEWQSFVAICYQEFDARLVLDTVTLGAGDADRLAPGALVVLPASFEPRWWVRLESPESGQQQFLKASLDADTGALDVAPSPHVLASWQQNAATVISDASVAPLARQNLLVSLQAPVQINKQQCEDAWQSGGSAQLGPLAGFSGLRMRLTLQPFAELDIEADIEADIEIEIETDIETETETETVTEPDTMAGEQVWFGTLLRIGHGFGVVLEDASLVDGMR